MAENIVTYTLNLAGNLSAKLKQIGISNDQQLSAWAKVEAQVGKADKTMSMMGRSVGSLNERVSALRAQKEWIPANNRAAIRQTNVEIEKLEKEIRQLNSVGSEGLLSKWLGPIKQFINPLTLAAGATYKLTKYSGEAKQTYQEESVQVAKLAQVMNNMMGEASGGVQIIKDLTTAQEKLGVVSGGAQLAGAQELSTYLEKRESLEKIIPAMNDMLAQQYGLNASQEQAVGIATMLGKVMQGQTGALSRYGYGFTKAQEKILQTGTEAQRAAVLFDVVHEAVGGVNEALAQTPEGKEQQYINAMDGIKARAGGVITSIRSSVTSIYDKIGELANKVVTFFETYQTEITQFMQVISKVVTTAFSVLWKFISGVWNVFKWFINGIREGNPLLIGLATVITSVTAAIILYNTYTQAAALVSRTLAFFKGIETAAWWANNAAMLANPVTWIIAGVVALIAVIAFLAIKVDGWGKQWESVVNFMKFTFMAYVESVKLYFSTLVNGIMIGIDKIKLGWYKFKEAVGIGDSSENQAMIAQISKDVEERKNAIVGGAEKVKEYAQKAKDSLTWELKTNDTTLSDVVGGLKSKLGIVTNEALQSAVGGGGDTTGGGSGTGSAANSAIATGGTRSTNIHINIKSLIENIIYQGGVKENSKELEHDLAEAIYRVLNMAETSVS